MITLPDWAIPNDAQPYGVDFGAWLQPSTGAEEQRFDRAGGRFGADITFPPMTADAARIVVSRLLAAHFGDTLKVNYPLLGVPQGSPGSPVVDGAGQSGTSLAVRGLLPGYPVKEGFWLNAVDENGRGYLHNLRANTRAGSDGKATFTIAPMLRWPFLDGATIRLATPTIEGRVPAQPWQMTTDKFVIVGCKIEEVA